MILYSIIPVDIVFGKMEAAEEISYFEAEYMGEKVLVSKLEDDDCVISRLISTNPRSFLEQKLQPGSIVKYGELKIKSR